MARNNKPLVCRARKSKVHHKQDKPRPYQCPECSQGFLQRCHYVVHYERVHLRFVRYCSKQKTKYTHSQVWRRHIKIGCKTCYEGVKPAVPEAIMCPRTPVKKRGRAKRALRVKHLQQKQLKKSLPERQTKGKTCVRMMQIFWKQKW